MTKAQEPSSKPAKKYVWEYPLTWLVVIGLLVGAKFLLPHFSNKTGWESSFSAAVIDLGKGGIPDDATAVNSAAEATKFFAPKLIIPPEVLQFDGAFITHAWRCKPFDKEGACLHLVREGEGLTMTIVPNGAKNSFQKAEFLTKGWGATFVQYQKIGIVLAGPFTPDELNEFWVLPQTK